MFLKNKKQKFFDLVLRKFSNKCRFLPKDGKYWWMQLNKNGLIVEQSLLQRAGFNKLHTWLVTGKYYYKISSQATLKGQAL
jgi:hypothetical protein